MKRILGILAVFALQHASAQNEFAANGFYTSVRKLLEDGDSAFQLNRGSKRIANFPELADEYNLKTLFPVADSGKIVIPKTGSPFAVLYFDPSSKREKIEARATHLREALITAFGKPFTIKTITSQVNNHLFSDTYYFEDANTTNTASAIFRTSVYFQAGEYFISLEIRGRKKD